MERSEPGVKRRVAETTDPWPSVGRLRTPKPRLIVALDRLPAPSESAAVLAQLRVFDPLALFVPAVAPGGIHGHARLGRQVTSIHGYDGTLDTESLVPMSQVIDQEKRQLAEHAAHVVCAPKTSSPNRYEQYLGLYRVAWALGTVGGLCGVVNPLAASFTPSAAVQNLISGEMVEQCRRRLPPQLFTSFIQHPVSGGVWCSTRGFEVFGVSNLAYFLRGPFPPLGDSASETDRIFGELWKLFLFAYEEGGILAPDHEVKFASEAVPLVLRRIGEVAPGWEPQLETSGGTLVLAPRPSHEA